ncbi:MAG: cell division protein FtsB [bacterium]
MRLLIAGLVVLTLLLQYRLWVGEGSLAEVWRLRQAVATQHNENQRLLMRNNGLEAEVRDLKQGMGAVEERARSELGMIRKGETFYQIIPSHAPELRKASHR